MKFSMCAAFTLKHSSLHRAENNNRILEIYYKHDMDFLNVVQEE